MKTILLGMALLGLGACSQQAASGDKQSEAEALIRRALALRKSQQLIKSNRLLAAHDTLSAALLIAPREDTLYLLYGDLNRLLSPRLVEEQARVIEKTKGGWARLEKGEYSAQYFKLSLNQSASLMREALLKIRPQLPGLAKAHAREKLQAQQQAVKEAKATELAAAKQQAATDAENYEKRGKVATGLRESFLDNGMDVEVKVSGGNRSRITLTYTLMGAVLEHKMEKEGNISALLDLGFKEVVLTDGYDFNRVWKRHK